MTIEELIKEGLLLLEMTKPYEQDNPLPGLIVATIKSLHLRGRYLIKNCDRITYDEYKSLFSYEKTYDLEWRKWSQYVCRDLQKMVGILQAINIIGLDNLKEKNIKHIFISHGKFTAHFQKLETFVRAFGIIPIYDTNEPSEGKTINKHVSDIMDKADFYLILATKETQNERGVILPNHNVTIELDRLVQLGKKNIVVLLENECKMPSMNQDIIYVSFNELSMDNAFIKIISEFINQNIL